MHDIAFNHNRTRETLARYDAIQAQLTLTGAPKIVGICKEINIMTDSEIARTLLKNQLNDIYLAMREDLGIDTRKIGN